MSSDRKKREKEQNQKAKKLKKEAKEKKRLSNNPNINPFAVLAEEPEPEPQEEEEEDEGDDEGDIVNLPPTPESDMQRGEEIDRLTPSQIKNEINKIIEIKTPLLVPGSSGVMVSDKTQIKKIMKNIVDNLMQRDSKYDKYKLLDTNDVKELGKQGLKSLLIDVEMMPELTKEEQLRGQLSNIEYNFEKSKEYVKNLGQKMATPKDIAELLKYFDNIYDASQSPTDKKYVKENELLELGEIIQFMLGGLYKREDNEQTKISLARSFERINARVDEVSTKIPENKIDKKPRILKDTKQLKDMQIENDNIRSMMKQAAQERLARQNAPKVKDPASGMEVKNPASGEVKMAASGEMVFEGKGAGKQKQPVVKKEEPSEPYKPLSYEDTNKPRLPSEQEQNAPLMQKSGDKAIGDVRSIGFLGPMDALAKADDVIVPESERSKSIRRFTNFRWVDSIQNSKLGYDSPFQRMDDIDNRRRYGKCFMPTNKLPKDPDTQEELNKTKGFNTYPLVPSYSLSGLMQPATEFSYKQSTDPHARKINIDEKQFANKKLYNFEETDKRIRPTNPFASSFGMESIEQSRRNPNNVKNTLEFSSVMVDDDPFKRIKNKYKTNVVA